jgi:hypothetical protein
MRVNEAPKGAREGLGHRRLADAGDVLEERVRSGKHADERRRVSTSAGPFTVRARARFGGLMRGIRPTVPLEDR